MKKFALFSLMGFVMFGGSAFAGCNPNNSLSFVGNQKPADDEFLYMNKKEFDSTVSGWENSNHYNSGDGHGYECDSAGPFAGSAGCKPGQVVDMPAGHYWKGVRVDHKVKYRCTRGTFGDDMWVVAADGCETKWGNLSIGRSYSPLTTVDCSGITKTEENVGLVKTWEAVCREGPSLVCKPHECIDGYEADHTTGRCVAKKKGGGDGNGGGNTKRDCPTGQERATKDISVISVCSGDKCKPIVKGQCYDKDFLKCMEAADRGEPANWNGKSCNCGDKQIWDNVNYKCVPKGNGGGSTQKKTCEQLYKGFPDRIACCNAGRDTEWVGSLITGRCECVDTTKKWDKEKKQCIATKPNDEEDGQCLYVFDAEVKCENGNSYKEHRQEYLKKSELEGMNCEDFNKRYGGDIDMAKKYFKDLCDGRGGNTIVLPPEGPSDREISEAKETMESFVAEAQEKASVWKNADGKFNSARLASDLTAGVVLGTVGGVVSGVVIKKNQVKKGFEALHCTVGGQKIADWGDEFSVGLQR